jgi:hypothetical protein
MTDWGVYSHWAHYIWAVRHCKYIEVELHTLQASNGRLSTAQNLILKQRQKSLVDAEDIHASTLYLIIFLFSVDCKRQEAKDQKCTVNI